jgi:hypothetical protein
MKLNLTKRITSVFGLNLSGKSYFVKNAILTNYKCLVIDILGEYIDLKCDVYIPKAKIYPEIAKELDEFIKTYIIPKANEYDLIIFEECNRIFPNKKEFMPVMRAFLDTYRHYGHGLGVVFVARRPAQVNTDIPSLSHNQVNFCNKGVSDIQRMNAESKGLGDMIANLSNHKFVLVKEDRTYKEYNPI